MPLMNPNVDPLTINQTDEGITDGVATWSEQLGAVYDEAILTSNSDSPSVAFRDIWSDVVTTISERDQKYFQNPGSYVNLNDAKGEYTDHSISFGYVKSADEVINYVKQNPERYPEFAWLSKDEVRKRAVDLALDSKRQLEAVDRRTPGGIGLGTKILGGVGAAATDPVNQASLLLGARGVSSLGGLVLREALINAGVEAVIQKPVAEWYETLGLDYGYEDFIGNVGAAFVFGGAMPLAINVGGKTVMLTAEQSKRGLEALRKAGFIKPKSPEDSALGIIDRQADEAKDNPLTNTGEHEARERQAVVAAESNEVPGMSNKPASPVAKPESPYDADNLDGTIFRFNPDEIQVDAETFQFKAGGDEFGVTERLQDVKQWDPVAAGQIVVFEKADGSKFIADGHQRLGLAKRIAAEDPSQDVRLYGHVLREVDGINEEMARVIAAIKNIKEGTGTAIDAAKVLRVAPEKIPELPPRSALVRQAQGLTLLDDEVFGAVINELISPSYAAIIGRLMPNNKALQMNAVKILNKVDPRNEFEAESIVQQIKAVGAEERTQVDLFGEEVVAESYYLERARVLDRALKQIRGDKASFNNLLKNAQRLEAEGNELASAANKRRVENDSQAIALLQAAANTKGGISDALTQAARLARESGSYSEATRNFVDAVRRGLAEGDFDRISAGDVGQFVDAPAQGRPVENEADRAVDGFDDPISGPDFKQQSDQLERDLFGAPDEALQPDEALRKDLGRLLDEGAEEATIDAHPAVTKAIDDALAIPETYKADGYGSDEWINTREFRFGDDVVVGYENAVVRLYDDAKKLGWTDEGLEPPANPVKNDRKAAIILGPPAAGKSTFANPIARKMNAAILDADEAKKVLPEYQGGIGANAVHEESSRIGNIIEDIATAEGTNIVIPKVGGSEGSIRKLIQRLKDKGYEVDLVDMQVSYSNARMRMYRRFVGTGRLIPPEYVKSVGDKPSQTYDILKKEGAADGYTRIDNNVGFKEEKPIIEDSRNLLEGTELRLRGGRADGGPGAREPAAQRPGEPDLEEVPAEIDLDLEIPVDLRVDPVNGETITTTQSVRALREEFAQDDAMLKRLEGCIG